MPDFRAIAEAATPLREWLDSFLTEIDFADPEIVRAVSEVWPLHRADGLSYKHGLSELLMIERYHPDARNPGEDRTRFDADCELLDRVLRAVDYNEMTRAYTRVTLERWYRTGDPIVKPSDLRLLGRRISETLLKDLETIAAHRPGELETFTEIVRDSAKQYD